MKKFAKRKTSRDGGTAKKAALRKKRDAHAKTKSAPGKHSTAVSRRSAVRKPADVTLRIRSTRETSGLNRPETAADIAAAGLAAFDEGNLGRVRICLTKLVDQLSAER